MAESTTCRSCGSPLPAQVRQGLCPSCSLQLARGGSDAEPELTSSTGRGDEPTVALGPVSSSVLARIDQAIGAAPRILLRDPEAEADPGPVAKPSSPARPEGPGRYQLHGEIA